MNSVGPASWSSHERTLPQLRRVNLSAPKSELRRQLQRQLVLKDEGSGGLKQTKKTNALDALMLWVFPITGTNG